MTALFTYSRQPVHLEHALAAFASLPGTDGATGLLYTPRQCLLTTLTAGRLRDCHGDPVDLTGVYEARLFCPAAELRWLNDPGPEAGHRAVILAEEEQAGRLADWTARPRTDVLDRLPQTYLLWGEGTGHAEHAGKPLAAGWSLLATARIGALPVPVAQVQGNERVVLRSVEYVVEAEHGNAVVFEERLLKLEVDRG